MLIIRGVGFLSMILITGAGGKTGKALTSALSNIESVCALAHRKDQVKTLTSLGAEKVLVGDLGDPSLVRSAMDGVRAVYHICPNMSPDEVGIGELAIRMARACGVEHFVYHSVLHPQTEKMNHHWQKLRVEEMLLESGLPFTILQPAPYMQNLMAGWKTILGEGILRVPYSIHARFSFIDLDDIAEAAKIILSETDHRFATYELAGTPPMSHVDVADVLGQVMKREVRAEREEIGPTGMLRENWRLRSGGIGSYAADHLLRMFEYYDRWGLVGNPNILRWVLRKEPTSLEAFIQRMLNEQNEIH